MQSLTPDKYAEKFLHSGRNSDPIKTIEFGKLIKERKLNQVKRYEITDVDINFANPEDGLPPLIMAVRNRDYSMLEHLLSLKDIDLNTKDKHKYNFTAVHHATQLKDMKSIKLLVEAGADFDLGSDGKNKGNTPLMVASWSGFYDAVDYYLSQGACANQQDSNGFTPLIKACIKHDLKAIKRLIPITDMKIRCRKNKSAMAYIDPKNKKSDAIIRLFKESADD